jgi:CheY-like chemotaxis protein
MMCAAGTRGQSGGDQKALRPNRRGILLSTTDPQGGLVRGPALISSLTLRRLIILLNSERTGVRGAPTTVPPLPAGRVLLIEDNVVNRGIFQRMINMLGVDCDTAADGATGTYMALNGPSYQVILMDLQMPKVDGLTATQRIRQGGCETPILALTATSALDDSLEPLFIGMNGQLRKPITLAELRGALAPYLDPTAASSSRGTEQTEPGTAQEGLGSTRGPGSGQLHATAQPEEDLADLPLVVVTVPLSRELRNRQAALATALDLDDREGLRASAHTLRSSVRCWERRNWPYLRAIEDISLHRVDDLAAARLDRAGPTAQNWAGIGQGGG